ncbi:MAG: hypothetical protein ACKVT1_14755 [Dehalococcoidia bacterium]
MGGTTSRDDRREDLSRQDPGEAARVAANPGLSPDVAAILNALDPFWTRAISPPEADDEGAPDEGGPEASAR